LYKEHSEMKDGKNPETGRWHTSGTEEEQQRYIYSEGERERERERERQ